MVRKLLGGSRYLILIAVLGSYLAAVLIILYTGAALFHIIIGLVQHPTLSAEAMRQLMLECIEVIDSFLLGTAFYIVALGLYELFISRQVYMPNWLNITTLEDLKAKLLGVIIVVLSVFFLEQVINWNGKRDILGLGIAVALIIGTITLTIKFQTHTSETQPTPPAETVPDKARE